MLKKQILIIMCCYASLCALPPDSIIVPAVVGGSTTGDFDGDAWFSFTLNDSLLLRLQVEGGSARDVYFYRGAEKIGNGTHKGPIYIHDCASGSYLVQIDRWISGGQRATVTIDTFSPGYQPSLELNKVFYSINNTARRHFYRFQLQEMSLVNLNRSYSYSGQDPDIEVKVWPPDTSFLFLKYVTTTFNLSTSSLILDTGLYTVEMILPITFSYSYVFELSAKALNVDEIEDNSTFDSARPVPLNDTLNGAFIGLDTVKSIDSVDWYKFTLDAERMIFLSTRSSYEFYSFEDSLDLLSSGTGADVQLMGRLGPGSYYTKLTGKNMTYSILFRDSTPPPVKNIFIDSAHLVASVTFDKNSEENVDSLKFTSVMDRNCYPKNAAEFASDGFLLEPPITDTAGFLSSFTISFWLFFQPPAESEYRQPLVSIGRVQSTGNSSLMLVITKGKKLELWIENENGQHIDSVDASFALWRVRWTHVAIVVEAGSATIYLDGHDVMHGPQKTVENYTGINIGRKQQTGGGSRYSGMLDDILIFDEALDSAGIGKMIDIDVPLGTIHPPIRKSRDALYRRSVDNEGIFTLSGRKLQGKSSAGQVFLMLKKTDGRKGVKEKILPVIK